MEGGGSGKAKKGIKTANRVGRIIEKKKNKGTVVALVHNEAMKLKYC